MNLLVKRKLNKILIIVAFLATSVGFFYIIYWADLPDKPTSFSKNQPAVVGDLTFLGEAQRFLKVYFSQSFVDESERLQFVRVEALRLAAFPVQDEKELMLRNELLKNLEQIIIKERETVFDLSVEEGNLQELFQQIP